MFLCVFGGYKLIIHYLSFTKQQNQSSRHVRKFASKHFNRLFLRKNSDLLPATSTNNNAGASFIELITVDSTNNYAMQLVNKGLAKSGTVVFAHEQTAGKGQRGKQWQATPGMNITMSLALNVNYLPVSRQFVLSAATALAAREFFDLYANGDTLIKWPNDIYWCDRKAGGILIENIIRGQEWQWAIVGIGININQTIFESDLANPVSLKQITGRDFNTVTMAKELCSFIDARINQLKSGNEESLLNEYNHRLYQCGKTIRLKRNSIVFNCLLKSVNEFGQLIVQTGIEQAYNVGEVEWQLEQ
jgi:BirA family biotin operon repressor/biotin-[acetyl-CoA-carboxylase] ligase